MENTVVTNSPIYTIMTFTELQEDKLGMLNIGSSRVVGFYHNLSDAQTCVIDNCGDIYETCYDYALIEQVEPGLYPDIDKRWLYKYNRELDKYEIMYEPAYMEHIVNFSMG